MKTNYLFPNRLKTISEILFVVSFLLLLSMFFVDYLDNFDLTFAILKFFGYSQNDMPLVQSLFYALYADEIFMTVCVLSGLVYAFSKQKIEDEFVSAIRMSSLAWATIINYVIFLSLYLLMYEGAIYLVLYFASLSQLVIFIVLFRYKMYRFYTTQQDEE